MREGSNIPDLEINRNEFEILKLPNPLPEFDIPDYDLDNPKEKNKYIDHIKRICRTSFEYREFMKMVRNNIDMNHCSFFENINNIDTFKIQIEIHHEPFTLENIVSTVYNKRVAFNEDLEENMVAKEVMYLHYNLMVGLIPLATTVHELVQNNYLYIPMYKVFGYVHTFAQLYEPYMDPELLDMFNRNKEFSKAYCEERAKNTGILEKHYIYIDPSGAYDIPKLTDVIESMNKRLDEIKAETGKQSQLKIIMYKNKKGGK